MTASDPSKTLNGRGRTILVLDDDPAIRASLRRILTLHGFRVLEAEDARTAFEAAQAESEIAAVICDLVLPGLGGREAANALRARHPDTPVLFTSGYSGYSSGRRDIVESGQPFLPKPFEVPELLAAVAELLGD